MKKAKKTKKEIKERKVLFKIYLIEHDTTQKAIAAELGISMTSILKSIERGAFVSGPFAEWWRKNIKNAESNSAAMNGTKEAAHDMLRKQTTQEVVA